MIASVHTTLHTTDAVLLIVIVVLFVITAGLALAETSLVRTSRARALALEDDRRRGARHLVRLVAHPEKFLNPVLLLVLICQLLAATLVGVVSAHLFGALGVVVATVFEVVVVFVLVEAAPKTWAVRHPDRAALLTAPVVNWMIRFPPVRLLSAALMGLVRLVLGEAAVTGGAGVTESELLALADVAMEEAVIEKEERVLIHSVIELGDTVVREVMVPRPDVVSVSSNLGAGAVLDRATEVGLSRIPVYEGNFDDVVGVAYVKDLVRAERSGLADRPVRSFARPAHFVPESKRVGPLMREMQAEKYHMAIVVDEYGGTTGIVTLEDLIEELVGEIVDEFDVEEPSVESLPGGEVRVPGRMVIDEANELLGAQLPSGEWDTVGGLVLHVFGHVPEAGESVVVDGHRLVVERVRGRRIERVRIAQVTHADGHGEGDGGAGPAGVATGSGR
ncbi:MAG: hemolysin family protein [Actinomycetota bacterium]|nr:hemolysin family protein [Actinomycetota bacterium]